MEAIYSCTDFIMNLFDMVNNYYDDMQEYEYLNVNLIRKSIYLKQRAEILYHSVIVNLPKMAHFAIKTGTLQWNVEHVNKKLLANLNELESLGLNIYSPESINTSEMKSAPNFKLTLHYNEFEDGNILDRRLLLTL